MARIKGAGINKTSNYEARPAMATGLFWLSELPAAEEEPNSDWDVKIDAALARKVRHKFGGNGKSFREAVEAALQKALFDVHL